MALAPGTRFGPYEIGAQIGVGGMGVVYRATDTNLKRAVAIKVLPEAVAFDGERLARFQREAEVLASLNHPNIAAIYGLERADTTTALVLELVEGPTLADGIARGSIPIDEALPIARQIADALEAAHEQGIVHRDLKPANVKVRPDGVVKVLDFGLAKALEPVSAGSTDATTSPTITSPAMMTRIGVILGTAAYMSPEQARGRTVDKRADIWAFGAVLYQMLTGRRAFPGDSISEVLAAVAHVEPDWSALPPSTPQPIRRLLKRSLEKDLRRRLPDIGVARLEIDEALTPDSSDEVRAAKSRPTVPWLVAAGIAIALAGALLGALAWRFRSPDQTSSTITRFSVTLGESEFSGLQFPMIALSPDGKQIVYADSKGLYLRSMSDLQARLIPGSENAKGGASNPAFSPDGQSIVFFSGGSGFGGGAIKRIAVTGGTAVSLLQMDFPPYGMSWGADGLMFGRGFGQDPWGVYRISPSGGPAELVIPADNEFVHGPQMLPDGHTVLLTVATGTAADRWDKARIVAHSLKSGERKTLIDGGSDARYLPTGHIVFARNQTLLAVPFDLPRLQVIGEPVPVVDEVGSASGSASSGAGQFAVSGTGSLVYMPSPRTLWNLAQVDRSGAVRTLNVPPGPYQFPRLSGDGTRIAVGTERGDEADVRVGELKGGGSLRRLTFGGRNRFPIWSADGERVTFQSDRDGDLGIFWQRADGTGSAERLTTAPPGTSHEPESWSPTGDHLLFRVAHGPQYSLWMLSLKDRKTAPFGGVESSVPPNAVFSPEGRWVAYMSREADKFLIVVQPFPATGTKYQVVDAGIFPLWSRDGKELFYFYGNSQFTVVNVLPQPGFTAGIPVELWTAPATKVRIGGSVPHRGLDPTPDGKFVALVSASQDQSASVQMQVVLNWHEELKRRVPVK